MAGSENNVTKNDPKGERWKRLMQSKAAFKERQFKNQKRKKARSGILGRRKLTSTQWTWTAQTISQQKLFR
jgi:hypothetical protein